MSPDSQPSTNRPTSEEEVLGAASPALDAEKVIAYFEVHAGNTIKVTAGEERFDLPGGGFNVGPIEVQLTLQEGERIDAAYRRARGSVEALFQAEFALKRMAWAARKRELTK